MVEVEEMRGRGDAYQKKKNEAEKLGLLPKTLIMLINNPCNVNK